MTSRTATLAQPARIRSRAGTLAWWAALCCLCGVLLAPLLVIDVPPLLDYPNHLGRVFVLASLPGDTVLARFYGPHWTVIPNLALDLIGPPLIHLLPVHVAGRVLVALAVLLPVLGAVAYNTALGGSWWSLGVGLVAYNSCLLYGFLNFSIGIGLALLLAAAWLRWRENRAWLAIIVATAGAPVLFACHLMGLVFFGLLVGCTEIGRLSEVRRNGLWRELLTRGTVLLVVFAAPAALYAASALQQLGGDAQFLSPGEKLYELFSTFANYAGPADTAAAALAFAVPALCVIARWGRVPAPAALAMAFLLAAFAAAPYAWKGTSVLDARFAIMLGFMLFAGFVPTAWPPGFRRIIAATLVVLFLGRMALLTWAWVQHRTDLADLRAALAPVQPGQAVYVAEVTFAEAPAYWDADLSWRRLSNGIRTDQNLGALALIEHRAYWPFEFDNPSQQPIFTRQPYASLAVRVDHIPSRAEAAAAGVCGFDYVLQLEADAVPPLPAERFRLLVRSGYAALYSIIQCHAP